MLKILKQLGVLFFVSVGVLFAAVAFSTKNIFNYFNTHVLNIYKKTAELNQCVNETELTKLKPKISIEDKIYFIGCGGFF